MRPPPTDAPVLPAGCVLREVRRWHDGAVARAYERHEGWVGYYWAPTALLGKYEMVKLDFGVPLDMAEWKRCTSVADCADPKPNSWPTDEVLTLVAKEFDWRGSFRFHEEFATAVALLNKGLVDVKPLISATLSYRDSARAFALAADRSQAMKVLLDFE